MQQQRPTPQLRPSSRFRIADLEIDTRRAEVTRDGQVVPLPKLSFDLLCALADAAPAIASLDELLAQVWPGLVVGPETVAQRVKLLRGVLGDEHKQPRYILAVRARGYRLIPAVEWLPEGANSGSTNTATTPAPTPAGVVSPSVPVEPPATSDPPRRYAIVGVILAAAAVCIFGVILWWLFTHSAAKQPVSTTAPGRETPALPARTVAVLPFVSIGTSPRDQALATGLAESIRLRLGGLSQMVVIAASSIAAYSGKNTDPQTAARELKARYLLEGTLQDQGESVRITAHLVDATSAGDVWSVVFDRKMENMISIQDEISTKVAQALKVTVDTGASPRGRAVGTNNIDAYLEYLQARGLTITLKPDDTAAAVEHYRRATALDPNFSAAYSGMAQAELNAATWGRELPADQQKMLVSRIRDSSLKALKLDPSNAEAYATLGAITDDDVQAKIYHRRAVDLDPNSAPTHYALAQIFGPTGQGGEQVDPVASSGQRDRRFPHLRFHPRSGYCANRLRDLPQRHRGPLFHPVGRAPNVASSLSAEPSA